MLLRELFCISIAGFYFSAKNWVSKRKEIVLWQAGVLISETSEITEPVPKTVGWIGLGFFTVLVVATIGIVYASFPQMPLPPLPDPMLLKTLELISVKLGTVKNFQNLTQAEIKTLLQMLAEGFSDNTAAYHLIIHFVSNDNLLLGAQFILTFLSCPLSLDF